MTPDEARARLALIRKDLELPKMMYGGNQVGPQADLYDAIDKIVTFLEKALV